jgi:hypothetical protein
MNIVDAGLQAARVLLHHTPELFLSDEPRCKQEGHVKPNNLQ